MGDQEEGGQKTELQATLERLGGERRFQVLNVGEFSAFDVRLAVASERGKNPPVSVHDLQEFFPLAELEPAESTSVAAIITPGTGLHFRAVVTWRNPDGSDAEGVFYISA